MRICHTCEDVGKPVKGWQWAYNTDIDIMGTSVWSGKGTQWCDCVALCFGRLTLETLTSAGAYIGIHIWPNKTVRDELLGSTYALVRKGMERVEHCAADRWWHKRAGFLDSHHTLE